MKELKKFGKVLNRKEMRSVSGGFRQCGLDDGFVCGPVCPPPEQNNGIQRTGWKCDNPNGACRPYDCEFPS